MMRGCFASLPADQFPATVVATVDELSQRRARGAAPRWAST